MPSNFLLLSPRDPLTRLPDCPIRPRKSVTIFEIIYLFVLLCSYVLFWVLTVAFFFFLALFKSLFSMILFYFDFIYDFQSLALVTIFSSPSYPFDRVSPAFYSSLIPKSKKTITTQLRVIC